MFLTSLGTVISFVGIGLDISLSFAVTIVLFSSFEMEASLGKSNFLKFGETSAVAWGDLTIFDEAEAVASSLPVSLKTLLKTIALSSTGLRLKTGSGPAIVAFTSTIWGRYSSKFKLAGLEPLEKRPFKKDPKELRPFLKALMGSGIIKPPIMKRSFSSFISALKWSIVLEA